MKKIKVVTLLILTVVLSTVPVLSFADTEYGKDISEITTYSLANASIRVSRSGSSLTSTGSIPTGLAVNSRMILLKKSGSSWIPVAYSSYSNSKSYSKTFKLPSKGTYRVSLRYSIGAKSDLVDSSSITY